MTKPIGTNRTLAIAAFARGETDAQISAALNISKQVVNRWRHAWLASPTVTASSGDPSPVQSHASNGLSHGTSPEPMPPGQLKGDQTPYRSSTWAEKTAIVVEAIVEDGVSRTGAYSRAGIPPSSGRHKFETDETFRAAILEAEARLESGPAKNLKELAMGKQQGAMIAAGIFLSRRFPREWQERRQLDIDVSGRVDHAHLHQIMSSPRLIELESAREAELQRLQAEQDARQLPAPTDAIDGEIVGETRSELP